MFEITDLHNHSLFELDDGADSRETTFAMLRASYDSGVRSICFTPHYFTSKNNCTPQQIAEHLACAEEYCREYLPEMKLYAGSEVSYHYDCVDAISDGRVLTLAGSRYILLDFMGTPDARSVVKGVERLVNSGYIPVVAHIERYAELFGRLEDVRRISDLGAVIQINAKSLLKGFMSASRRQCMKLFAEGLVDLVASDAHDLQQRPPDMKKAVELVISKFGYNYAEEVFCTVPQKILSNQRV